MDWVSKSVWCYYFRRVSKRALYSFPILICLLIVKLLVSTQFPAVLGSDHDTYAIGDVMQTSLWKTNAASAKELAKPTLHLAGREGQSWSHSSPVLCGAQLPLCSSCSVCPIQARKCNVKDMGYITESPYRFVLNQKKLILIQSPRFKTVLYQSQIYSPRDYSVIGRNQTR